MTWNDSRTIDMNLGPLTTFDKRNKITSKNFDNDVISANCDAIVFFPIYDQFWEIRTRDFGCLVWRRPWH